jgi:hypothetical protein
MITMNSAKRSKNFQKIQFSFPALTLGNISIIHYCNPNMHDINPIVCGLSENWHWKD